MSLKKVFGKMKNCHVLEEKVYSEKVPRERFFNTAEDPLLICINFIDYSYYYHSQGDNPMVKQTISTYFTPPNNNEVIVNHFKEGEKPMPSREEISAINQNEASFADLRSPMDYFFDFFSIQNMADLIPYFKTSAEAPTCCTCSREGDLPNSSVYLSSPEIQ